MRVEQHVKGKAFTSDLGDFATLAKFIYAEALPIITRIPFNMGPDAGKRRQVRRRVLAGRWVRSEPLVVHGPVGNEHGRPETLSVRED